MAVLIKGIGTIQYKVCTMPRKIRNVCNPDKPDNEWLENKWEILRTLPQLANYAKQDIFRASTSPTGILLK